MIPPLNVSPEARDITFKDSCNCCFRKPTSPSMHVYVNSLGEVVEFDKNKCKSESEAIVKSIDHLSYIVERMIEDRKIDKIDILDDISNKIKCLKQNCDTPITREFIEDIVYQIHSSPKNRKSFIDYHK